MTRLRRTARATAAALLAGLLNAACSDAQNPSGPLPAPTGSVTASAQAGGPTTGPAAVVLPWPAGGAVDAAALQAAVDAGSQPWLLDPSEVAISYASAAHGWSDAEAYPGPAGTSVDVRNADGERLTLTLVQPARTGSAGIWVVTAEHPA